MFVPKPFRPPSDEAALAVVEANPFGIVIACEAGRPMASHTPMLLDRQAEKLVLSGHLARANSLHRLLQDRDVLAVFEGAHTHISPTWYTTAPAVPTWDYVAVHLTGRAQLVEDSRAIVEELSQRFEGDGWRLGDQPGRFGDSMLKAIIGFRIEVSSIEASFKLSQNRSAADRQGVVDGLRARQLPGDIEVAELIESP